MSSTENCWINSVVEQESAKRILSSLLESKNLAPLYVFEGPRGVGKFHTAMAFIKDLLQISPQAEKRISESKMPDVRVFHPREEGQGNLKVETIREEIIPFVKHAPYQAESTWILFPSAELTFSSTYPASANSLLKTFEEPRPHVHFILLTERYDALLPTIRSRAQRVKFHALSNEAIKTILREQYQKEPSDFLLFMSQGSVKKALDLLEEESLENRLSEAIAVQKTIEQEQVGAFVSKAEWMTKERAPKELLEILLFLYRMAIRKDEGTSEISVRMSADTHLMELGMDRNVQGAKHILHAIGQLSTNLNPQMVCENLMIQLSQNIRA